MGLNAPFLAGDKMAHLAGDGLFLARARVLALISKNGHFGHFFGKGQKWAIFDHFEMVGSHFVVPVRFSLAWCGSFCRPRQAPFKGAYQAKMRFSISF